MYNVCACVEPTHTFVFHLGPDSGQKSGKVSKSFNHQWLTPDGDWHCIGERIFLERSRRSFPIYSVSRENLEMGHKIGFSIPCYQRSGGEIERIMCGPLFSRGESVNQLFIFVAFYSPLLSSADCHQKQVNK